jgi:RNA polymerase sigma factor (sigma-70 family)
MSENYDKSRDDDALVQLALSGDGAALQALLGRHQAFLFNVALRFLQVRSDAEDATQEALLRIATRLSSFRRGAKFRTWAYRIAFNHLLDRARSRPEDAVRGFDCYAEYLARAPDSSTPEQALLVAEAALTCSLGMLLCFDREQRLVFILGEIFELSDREGSELVSVSPENFRQKLARARQQLSAFMQARCGLVDARNPCRCAQKTRAFVRDGIVNPQSLTFARGHLERAEEQSVQLLPLLVRGPRELFRTQPLFEAPDFAPRVRELMSRPEGRRALVGVVS